MARELVNAFPDDSWAEEALNNLATHYILADDDERADATFREILERFPQGRHAQRAAWKVGWTAYRNERFDETVRQFEQAAARFPRSDYRPAWLYWAGRAHERLGHADRRRRALRARRHRLPELLLRPARGAARSRAATSPAAPPVDRRRPSGRPPRRCRRPRTLIRQLIAQELYDRRDERAAVRAARLGRLAGDPGDDRARSTRGRGELRRGINAMKRAYPQYIAAGGEALPVEMLKVLFPVALLGRAQEARGRRTASIRTSIAALIAQESTFDARRPVARQRRRA